MLIDTSIWIEALRVRGSAAVREQVIRLVESRQAAWCPVIRLELWAGIGDAWERSVLSGFTTVVRDLPATDRVWDLAIRLAGLGRSRGHTFPIPDLIVFASGEIHGLELLHQDRHFDTLKRLIAEEDSIGTR